MSASIVPVDPAALRSFRMVDVYDPREMGTNSAISSRLPSDGTMFSYRLQDRTLLRLRFDSPITSMATRPLGDMSVSDAVADALRAAAQLLGAAGGRA